MTKETKNNCVIHEIDLGCFKLYSREEAIDLWGEGYLEDFGISLPENLLRELETNQQIVNQHNEDLRRILREKEAKEA
jgi:hypothetical protein